MSEKQNETPAKKPKEWYIKKGEKHYGPYSSRELKNLAHSGKIEPSDEVQTGRMGQWVPAEKVKGLFPVDEEGKTITYDEKDIDRFKGEIKELTPQPYVMYGIIIVNLLIFIVMSLTTLTIFEPDIETLITWGANFGPKTLAGEWWRLFACMFLHAGLLHVAFNMWVLFDAGRLVERMLGNTGFAIMYFGSGLIGSLASLVWNPYVVSVGASGAVFGVYGALLGFFTVKRHAVPKGIWRPLSKSAVLFIGYNMVYGIFKPGIDVAAHVGGLGAGFVFGLIMAQDLKSVTKQSRTVRNMAAGAAGAAAVIAVCFMIGGPLPDIQEEIMAFAKTEERVINGLQSKTAGLSAGSVSEEDYGAYLEQHVLPEWTKARERFEHNIGPFRRLPAAQREFITVLSDYMKLRQEIWTLMADSIKTNDEMKAFKANKKQIELQALSIKVQSLFE